MRPNIRTCAFTAALVCAACDGGQTAVGGMSQSDKSVTDSSPTSTDKSVTDSSPTSPTDMGESTSEGPAVSIRHAQQNPMVHAPMDATPAPDGEVIYYLATADASEERTAGVFKVDADGGELVTLALGAPLEAPTGIAISVDGATLFVADMVSTGGGAILRGVSAGDGQRADRFSPVKATAGLLPRALTVALVKDEEHVYFTGQDPESGWPAVYRLVGDHVDRVALGAPLVSPAGITVTADGTAYVVDELADDGSAALIRTRNGQTEIVLGGLGVGFPAGITTDLDETTALVSGLDPETGRDVVYLVNLSSLEVTTITDPIDAFSEPAGVHRAHNANVFAWADAEANDTGTVYVLEL